MRTYAGKTFVFAYDVLINVWTHLSYIVSVLNVSPNSSRYIVKSVIKMFCQSDHKCI